jgi:hypothetical protein
MLEPNENQPSLSAIEFQLAKTNYFSQFAMNYAAMFRPHYRSGDTLAKTFGDKASPDIWRNVAQHCLVEAAVADVLAEELQLPADERRTIVSAAILHDWYKKREKEQIAQATTAGTYSSNTLKEIEVRGDAELREKFGIDPTIIELTHSNVAPTPAGPETLAKKILWYVDHIVSNTDVVPIEDRIADAERGWDGTVEDPNRAAFNGAMSDRYKEKYGGRSLYDVQREIGQRLNGELSERIGFAGKPEDLPLYLKAKLEARFTAGA